MIGATFCSGIGAPELAAPWVDWRLASEIEPFPRAVLQERFGYQPAEEQEQGAPVLCGDMLDITPGTWRKHGIPLPDVVVAGTPCQAFSVAGLRKGTKDARGNLTLKFVEIVYDLVAARPDGKLVVLWENVPGILSDKRNAFGAFLGGLVGADGPVFPCPRPPRGKSTAQWTWNSRKRYRHHGRRRYRKPHHSPKWSSAGMVAGPLARAAWRVLDAQYFGVPQRRRRVFVVVDFGNCVDPAAVLFERQGVRGNTPPRRKAGQDVAGTLDASTGGASGKDWQSAKLAVQANSGDVGFCLTASAQGSLDAETETLIASATGSTTHALTAEGHDASEDGSGRGTPVGAFDANGTELQTDTSGVAPPLRSMGHKDSHQNGGGHSAIAIQERAISENPNSGPDGAGVRDDGTAYTLEARQVPQAVAFAENQRAEIRVSSTVPALGRGGGKPGQGYPAVAFDQRGRDGGAQFEGPHDTANLRAASGGSSRSYVAAASVRRLMPVECARLQGMPDDHTAITYRGKPAADGPQYKAYGNSMARPNVEWIMDRIRISWEAHR